MFHSVASWIKIRFGEQPLPIYFDTKSDRVLRQFRGSLLATQGSRYLSFLCVRSENRKLEQAAVPSLSSLECDEVVWSSLSSLCIQKSLFLSILFCRYFPCRFSVSPMFTDFKITPRSSFERVALATSSPLL